jgi:hypothetical protein
MANDNLNTDDGVQERVSAGKHVQTIVTVTEEQTPKPKTSWWRWTVGLVWDSVEGDARNRRYVQKLDSFLL